MASDGIKRRYVIAAEVADQDGVAEFTEIRRGPYNAPRSIEPIAVLKLLQQPPMTVEDIHEAVAWLAWLHRIVPGRILLGIGYVNVGSDPLNIERREVTGNAIVFKQLLRKVDRFERCVEQVDPTAAEIGRQDKFVSIDFRDGRSLINRPIPCSGLLGVVSHDNRTGAVHSRIPALHRPVFCDEHENGRRLWREKKIGCAAIKHNPCRRPRRRLAGSIWDFYKLVGSRINRDYVRCTGCVDGIKSRRPACIVRNPPRTAGRAGNKSPGIL